MQNSHQNESTRPRRLAVAMAAAAVAAWAGPAQADEPTPWYVGASQSITHDSNVYRLADGPGDNYSSTGVLGGFDQLIGRQHVFGAGNIRYNKYRDQTTLDNTSYGVNAGWDWATIEKLSGSFNVSAQQALASLGGNATIPTTSRNLVKSQQYSTGVRWGGEGRLLLNADYAHSRVRYSAPEYVTSASSADTASVGSFYSFSPDLRVGSAVRLTRTTTPFGTQTSPGVYESTSSNGRNLDLLVDLRSTAQTSLNARLSFTRQSNAGAEGRDFSGLTGSFGASYAPTAKLAFGANYSRDAGTNGTFFNVIDTSSSSSNGQTARVLYDNSQTTDSLSGNASYAATAKISANASLQYRRAKIVNSTSGGSNLVSASDYTDRYRYGSLGVTYQVARAAQLSCNVSHERRDTSSTSGFGYSANVASCSAQLTLR